MIRLPPLTWSLIGLNALVLVALLLRLSAPSVEELERSVPKPSIAVPSVATDSRETAPDFAAIRDRAIFYTSRAFIAPPDPAAVQQSEPSQYQFVAALVLPERPSIAYLRKSGETGSPIKVKVGEQLDGWTVALVERQRVVLEHEGRQFEIGKPSPGNGALTNLATAQASATATPGSATQKAAASRPRMMTPPRRTRALNDSAGETGNP